MRPASHLPNTTALTVITFSPKLGFFHVCIRWHLLHAEAGRRSVYHPLGLGQGFPTSALLMFGAR